MQSRLEQETLTVIQTPADRYPFVLSSSSPIPPPTTQERDPRSTKHTTISTGVKITTSTNTTLSTVAKSTNASITTGVRGVIKDAPSHAKKHGERITSFAVGLPPPSPSGGKVKCLLFIENDQDVLMGLESDVISVKILLASPHLGSLRTRAEALKKTLLQLKEMVDLLSQCQDKVGYGVCMCVCVCV